MHQSTELSRRSRPWHGLVVLAALSAGCAVPGPSVQTSGRVVSRPAEALLIAPVAYRPGPQPEGSGAKESAPSPPPAQPAAPSQLPPDSRFDGLSELTPAAVVQQVLQRNPTLAQMVAARQAAAARYPQVTSLDDPMFSAQVAPGAFGSNTVDGGYRFDISQKYPWCGKLALRGEAALAEAAAAASGVDDTRLQLVEAAKDAFYDYYLVARALEVNAENLRLLREFRQNAETRYKTGRGPQQDLLQADVEIGKQQERQFALERMRQVAVARINTLMHLPPDLPLPPPPAEIKVEDGLPPAPVLRETALSRRPDLRALASRVAADRASLGLAHKEYCPDVEVMAAYDTFWQERPLQAQLGVKVNLPVRLARRGAAVAEAEARLAERQAELARHTDDVNYEVEQAYAQVHESARAVRLYEKTVLPAAEANVKSAQAAYVNGQIPFLTLVEAERNVVSLRDRSYELVADYYRRLAALERAVGGPVADPATFTPCPAAPPPRP